MTNNRMLTIGFWGFGFMLFFLYAYNLTFTLTAVPMLDPELYGQRTTSLKDYADTFRNVLGLLSFPIFQHASYFAPLEPFFFELVYRPYLAAFQWFGYGCLFGWWRYRRKSRRSSI